MMGEGDTCISFVGEYDDGTGTVSRSLEEELSSPII